MKTDKLCEMVRSSDRATRKKGVDLLIRDKSELYEKTVDKNIKEYMGQIGRGEIKQCCLIAMYKTAMDYVEGSTPFVTLYQRTVEKEIKEEIRRNKPNPNNDYLEDSKEEVSDVNPTAVMETHDNQKALYEIISEMKGTYAFCLIKSYGLDGSGEHDVTQIARITHQKVETIRQSLAKANRILATKKRQKQITDVFQREFENTLYRQLYADLIQKICEEYNIKG